MLELYFFSQFAVSLGFTQGLFSFLFGTVWFPKKSRVWNVTNTSSDPRFPTYSSELVSDALTASNVSSVQMDFIISYRNFLAMPQSNIQRVYWITQQPFQDKNIYRSPLLWNSLVSLLQKQRRNIYTWDLVH